MKKVKSVLLMILILISLLMLLVTISTTKMKIVHYEGSICYKNIEYGTHQRNVFDICIPKNDDNKMGLILMIHPGGWVGGDKSCYDNDLIRWSEKGYVVATMNYRYAGQKAIYSDILDDISNCLRKIKSFTNSIGITVEKAMLCGGSAGGHLSLLYGYSRKNDTNIEIVASVSMSGPTDLTDQNYFIGNVFTKEINSMFSKLIGEDVSYDTLDKVKDALSEASPINYIDENSIPSIICHGKNDTLVPYTNAEKIVDVLTKYNIVHELITFPTSGHGLESDPECMERANYLMEIYAKKYLA